jgi:hypothetical protein
VLCCRRAGIVCVCLLFLLPQRYRILGIQHLLLFSSHHRHSMRLHRKEEKKGVTKD